MSVTDRPLRDLGGAAAGWAAWRPSTPYTVGVEEEVMLLRRGSRTLAQDADRVLGELGDDLIGHCGAETHEAAIELRTGPHATAGDAVAELDVLRARLARDADRAGVGVAVAGMHPGTTPEATRVSPGGRYQLIHQTMRGLARRDPTFALHVHVGMPDPASAITVANRLRAHVPLLLALSASSPLWRGEATGLASNRTALFQAFPRTGLPRVFGDYADWVHTVDVLVSSGAILEPTFLWWDVRLQPRLGTVEVRVMDAQPTSRATAALCALVQALARLELEERHAPRELVEAQEVLAENRFLAARDGTAAELVDPIQRRRVPLVEQLADVLVAAAPHASALGVSHELADVPTLVSDPEPARQEAIAAAEGVEAVVCDLAARFAA